jgi:hypothetical protein
VASIPNSNPCPTSATAYRLPPFIRPQTPLRRTRPAQVPETLLQDTRSRSHSVLLLGAGDGLDPRNTGRGKKLDGGLQLGQRVGIVQGADLPTISLISRSTTSSVHTLTILLPSNEAVSLNKVEPQSPLAFG